MAAGRYAYQKLLVVSELVRQQTILDQSDSRSIPDRIISLSVPPRWPARNSADWRWR